MTEEIQDEIAKSKNRAYYSLCEKMNHYKIICRRSHR